MHVGYIHYCWRQGRLEPIAGAEDARGRQQSGGRDGTPARRGTLEIIVSNSSAAPIYEQIAQQVKDAILTGELAEGTLLPSIRALANSLRISVITTKRAYAELEEAGFVTTVQGKGTFVAGGNLELLREERLRHIEQLLSQAVADAEAAGCTPTELHEMLDLLIEG